MKAALFKFPRSELLILLNQRKFKKLEGSRESVFLAYEKAALKPLPAYPWEYAPRLFNDLAVARRDGRYTKLMKSLARTNLLIIDEWGLSSLTDIERTDLLEVLEDRHNNQSTIVTSQLPVKHWHETIGNPTLADAILDRQVQYCVEIRRRFDA